MRITTLCYLEKDGCYLMLHRTKKEHDVNRDKWIGVGGGVENGESIEECLVREVREETGYTLLSWTYRGRIAFSAEGFEDEIMHLFSSDSFCGSEISCSEGDLVWIKKEDVAALPTWEGDRFFLRELAADSPFFVMTLAYKGDKLVFAEKDGADLLA